MNRGSDELIPGTRGTMLAWTMFAAYFFFNSQKAKYPVAFPTRLRLQLMKEKDESDVRI